MRVMLVAALALLGGAWVASLPIAQLLAPLPGGARAAGAPLVERLDRPAGWRDMLILKLAATDAGIQQRYAYVVWSQRQPQGYARLYQLPFVLRADGQTHSYVVPVGAHPEWRGDVSHVVLKLQQPTGLAIAIADARLVTRSAWALDALLGRAATTYLPVPPPWPAVILLVAALVGGGLALAWPASHWRRRLAVAGMLLGGATGVAAVGMLVTTSGQLYRIYGPLDERSAMIRVPAYDAPAQISQALVAVADQLPAGPVLAVSPSVSGYLSNRARYLFYPRLVTTIAPTSPAELRRMLASGYTSLVGAALDGRPPLPGWRRIGDLSVAPPVWVDGTRPPPPAPAAGPLAPLRLAVGIGLVLLIGWSAAGAIGWRGWARWCCAWPIGILPLAWWMFALNAAGLAWSPWSIGLPLVAGALLLALRDRRRAPGAPAPARPRSRLELVALPLLVLIVGIVVARALLLPFSDVDTWTIWGLRGRGFFLDGRIDALLLMYDNVRYPPAQSLVQTWGYLAMGGLGERMVKVIFPLWYAACLGIIWSACRGWSTGARALGWTLLAATTPILLDHATLGNADLPLAAGLLAGAFALCRWLETADRRWMVGGMLLLGGAAWIKFDGAFLGIGVLGAAILARVVGLRRRQGRTGRTLVAGGVAVAAIVGIALAWHLYARLLVFNLGDGAVASAAAGRFFSPYRLIADVPRIEGLRAKGLTFDLHGLLVCVEEVLFSHSNSTWSLLGSGYGALWIVCAGALVSGWRRMRDDPVLLFLVLAVAGGLGFYFAFYTLMPAASGSDYFFSVERYLLHIAPLAILAAARATSGWLSNQANVLSILEDRAGEVENAGPQAARMAVEQQPDGHGERPDQQDQLDGRQVGQDAEQPAADQRDRRGQRHIDRHAARDLAGVALEDHRADGAAHVHGKQRAEHPPAPAGRAAQQ
jgi:hypothetical protein